MKKNLMIAACCLFFLSCNTEKKEDSTTDDASKSAMASDAKTPDAVLLDLSNADLVKKSFAAFSNKDVAGMTADYDDNISYNWSNGDSLRGKKAVADYYEGRWKLLDTLSFANEIVLPLQVNKPQIPIPAGKWILYWNTARATYKNGKTLNFFTHTVNHLNAAGKVDFIRMYYDRTAIVEATKDMMK